MSAWRDDPASIRPMLASTADAPLDSRDLAYEPKYDGIRALVSIEPARRDEARAEHERSRVRFWSRLGNEKTRQFPEIAAAIGEWARGLDRPMVVDGEIVALNGKGTPIGFQNLQGRIHLKNNSPDLAPRQGAPYTDTAFIAFDLLRDGDDDVRGLPLRERRARLERLFARSPHPLVRISEQAVGDGRALHARAQANGWEGLVAKRLSTPYHSGRRSPDWRKIKLVRHQTCVIGGWTDPRGTRPFFGALLLG
ncbi:MAG: hypothetical protein ACREUC_04105, partial [Steroidobacteraceae bacterium]